ncbi:3041_t:CDS:1 [Cetraspora pellucida]|uniref:3041_t:CDS:1 n=1 Tax=Cetraspora pellucida TaxID=1433469 RepID=A0A9N9HCV2_9GLOM|nr:3041_t:CDS:1 [Cetraspora pellucida]
MSLSLVSFEPSIYNNLKDSYPTIAELVQTHNEGTLAFLKANDALFPYVLKKSLEVKEPGDDNYKTWTEYLSAIEVYLEDLCNQDSVRRFKEHLRPARKELANEIHQKHYERFPLWPQVGQIQNSHVELGVANNYSSTPYIIIWACVGWINVQDSRPYKDKYIAEFNGKPDLKILALDNSKLRRLEELFKSDKNKALEQVSNRGKLTWEELK